MARKVAKDKHFLKQPIFKGGKKAMDLLVKMALVYPKEALDKKIEGSVYLKYEISYKGKVQEVKVLSGLGNGCDEEAIRIVKLFTFEVPPIPRKMKVVFNKNVRIHFRLPKPQKQVEQKMQYQITSTAPKTNKKSNGKDKAYHYTINW